MLPLYKYYRHLSIALANNSRKISKINKIVITRWYQRGYGARGRVEQAQPPTYPELRTKLLNSAQETDFSKQFIKFDQKNRYNRRDFSNLGHSLSDWDEKCRWYKHTKTYQPKCPL